MAQGPMDTRSPSANRRKWSRYWTSIRTTILIISQVAKLKYRTARERLNMARNIVQNRREDAASVAEDQDIGHEETQQDAAAHDHQDAAVDGDHQDAAVDGAHQNNVARRSRQGAAAVAQEQYATSTHDGQQGRPNQRRFSRVRRALARIYWRIVRR